MFEGSKFHCNFCSPNCMSLKQIDQTMCCPKIVHLFSTTICTLIDETKQSSTTYSINMLWWYFWSTEYLLNLDSIKSFISFVPFYDHQIQTHCLFLILALCSQPFQVRTKTFQQMTQPHRHQQQQQLNSTRSLACFNISNRNNSFGNFGNCFSCRE